MSTDPDFPCRARIRFEMLETHQLMESMAQMKERHHLERRKREQDKRHKLTRLLYKEINRGLFA